MRRLLLGLTAFLFLLLVGTQAVHHHETLNAGACHTCALGSQTVRHAPAAAPEIVTPVRWESAQAEPVSDLSAGARRLARARAPPAA